nr:unnamed protein product [Spirometra erinaceieuropaei]
MLWGLGRLWLFSFVSLCVVLDSGPLESPAIDARFLVTENGRIYLRFSDLDRESTPVYVLHLAVIDRGSPPRASNFCVTVVVKDVNDCNPKFLFPILNNNSVTVFLPIQKGATVAQVQAIDADDLENANLQFSFTEDSDPLVRSLFTIDAISGWITMKRFVSAEELQLPGLPMMEEEDEQEELGTVGQWECG